MTCEQCGEPVSDGYVHDDMLDVEFCDDNCRTCYYRDHAPRDLEASA